ncbi:sugar ABC transporter ATP-binding protein [Silvimonas amylolytica]|uniref:Sugar ABC transporter ATP-binding protein n=1 Tax=Silvimonas amylolytica TaxID=449663 RepID=A0ABQ2PIC6_9NEIS|nr:sugar ABC transporter ATP-binding protein [Silvimonas amylolytica]GGP24996.1 sugar ABC transporter ATP-binding protein [Silvimonas amylolytica]
MTQTVTAPLLEMRDISKAFSGVPALKQARLSIAPGEVHALIGQNGAGKSTLIKILTGAYKRDAGEILFGGQVVHFTTPLQAQKGGISTIYQELNLIPLRSVAENIFLGREPRKFGLIDWPRIHADAAALLDKLGIVADVRLPLNQCNTATQQMVAIARAVSLHARLVIMDEPTSSLDEQEVETLFRVIRQLKADGVSVIFVSHRLDELYAVCDRVTVMRDGQTVAEKSMQEMDKLQLVTTMLGRELASTVAQAASEDIKPDETRTPTVETRALKSGVRVNDASMAVYPGEIVGLAGLLGAGRTELARCLFGADRVDQGEILLKGKKRAWQSPSDAIAHGVAYLSEDRKIEGIIPDMSVEENLTLVLLPRLVKLGVVDRKQQHAIVQRFIERLQIKTAGPKQKIRELSGGNQQKVLLARWLCAKIDFLMLDEPTRGIDVGAKAEILTLIRELADDGLGVLMIASELEELTAYAQRVVVLRDGYTVRELSGSQINEDNIMAAMANATAKDNTQAERAP